MSFVSTSAPEENLGVLRCCLVEGDTEQEKHAHRVKNRALLFSIALQTVFVASLVLFPLLSRGERISLKDMTLLPPHAPGGGHRSNPETRNHPHNNPPACKFCFSSQHSPTIPSGDPKARTDATEPLGEGVTDFRPGSDVLEGEIPGGNSEVPLPPDTEKILSHRSCRLAKPSRQLSSLTASSQPTRQLRNNSAGRGASSCMPSSRSTEAFKRSKSSPAIHSSFNRRSWPCVNGATARPA
jgi:hypothetical protein